MNDYSQPPAGKISVHGNGLGAPSPEEVEKRAREIAMIDERNPDEFTEADWRQARHELMGAENNTPPEETPDNAELTEEWSVVASSKGHRMPRPGTEEEETVGEHWVIDGLEEATHDQMLEARREELEQEDYVVQSMPDVSPTKWHLAHTTWFFETFILKKFSPGYRSEIPQYAYLFNSYYNAAGDMHRRDLRGLISRPTVSEAQRYRASIDSRVDNLLSSADERLLDESEPILILGFHHEQQHQELLVSDIKHVFALNPLYPVFREVALASKIGRA